MGLLQKNIEWRSNTPTNDKKLAQGNATTDKTKNDKKLYEEVDPFDVLTVEILSR